MAQPLEGIVVADFSHVMAGPFASHLLRLLGATVIKIEEPRRGDAMRYYGADRRFDGMAPAFVGINAGKKSIGLDLKDEQQLETAKRIIRRSDVLLENFRPGVMARLGLDYEQVRSINPDIVYCSVSGYGQTDSPYRDWPAIDNIVQATSGMMNLGGEPGDPPIRVGFPVVDTLTGQTAALAILGGLLRRERSAGGEYIDVAMLDASLAFMTSAVSPFLITGTPLPRTGNIGYSGQPTSGVFETADGRMITLGVVQQSQFVALANYLGRKEWLDDPRFATPDDRRTNSDVMHEELSRVMRTKTAAVWEEGMSAIGIPCGMVRDVSEAVEFSHLRGRRATLPIELDGIPTNGSMAIVNAGFVTSGDGPGVSEPPPALDEHRDEILRWLEDGKPGFAQR